MQVTYALWLWEQWGLDELTYPLPYILAAGAFRFDCSFLRLPKCQLFVLWVVLSEQTKAQSFPFSGDSLPSSSPRTRRDTCRDSSNSTTIYQMLIVLQPLRRVSSSAIWHGGRESWPWSQTTWGCTWALPLTSFVTFGKLLNLSEPVSSTANWGSE